MHCIIWREVVNVDSSHVFVYSRLVIQVTLSASHWLLFCRSFQTDRAVDTQNINMHETQVTQENLSGLSGLTLVHWAANHGYGPAVSYSNIKAVNKVVLTVDGGGVYRKNLLLVSLRSAAPLIDGSLKREPSPCATVLPAYDEAFLVLLERQWGGWVGWVSFFSADSTRKEG